MSSAEAVDAYWEYTRIVGDDDGGKPMSEAEFERYKREKGPKRIQNRLFVAWTNTKGLECKLIGPETMCFCKHRYKQHETELDKIPTERPILIRCRQKACKCSAYLYLPWSGGGPIRCTCKHPGDEHSEDAKHKCKKPNCKCEGFRSSYTCQCGEGYSQHVMIVETKPERVARGKPVGQDTIFQAMGGITGFSSMLDGYMRMDTSGVGAPSKEVLEKPITDQDHPFIRIHKSNQGPEKSVRIRKSSGGGKR